MYIDDIAKVVKDMAKQDVNNKVDQELIYQIESQMEAEGVSESPYIGMLGLSPATRAAIANAIIELAKGNVNDANLLTIGFDLGCHCATAYKKLGREWPF